MFILLFITDILFKISKPKKFNFIDVMTRIVLDQSSNDIMVLYNRSKNVTLIILLVIWLQSASILSKAFSGLLLNTYFNVKSVPIVNSLEDIINNQDINVAINLSSLKKNIQDTNLFDQKTEKHLYSRVSKYQDQVDYISNYYKFGFIFVHDKLLEDVIMGKTVMIVHSLLRNRYFNYYKYYHDQIRVVEQKYLLKSLYLMVKRNVIIKSWITKM